MDNKVIEKNRKKVKEILEKNGFYKIPVDIVSLAKAYGFVVFQQPLNFDGAILVNEEEPIKFAKGEYHKIITVNIDGTLGRKIFTIAHELAHYLMEEDSNIKTMYAHRKESNESYQTSESNVNSFASELLMPFGLLKNFLDNNNIKEDCFTDFSVVKMVANTFGVSLGAASVRLNKLKDEVAYGK